MTGTDPTDDQLHGDLEDRLAHTFAQQATTVVPTPAPLPTILERSRRRRTRRHTAMVLAGVLVLVLSSAAVLTRVRDEVGISTDSTYGSSGTGNTTREGSGDEVPASFGDDGSADGWSTSLPRIGLDLPGAQVIGAVDSPGTDGSASAGGDNVHQQRYRVDPNDLGSPSLELTASRLVSIPATGVATMVSPDAIPTRIQGRDGRIVVTRQPDITEVLWLAEDGRLMRLTATGVIQDEVVDIAQKLTPRGDGGFTFPPLPHGLVPILDRKGPDGHGPSSATTYTLAPEGIVVLNVMQGSRGDFDDLASHGPAWQYEYHNIFGYRGVVASRVETPSTAVVPVGPDSSQVVQPRSVEVMWYEPDHDAIIDVQLPSAPTRLDDVLAHLVRVDESTYRSYAQSAGTSVLAFPGSTVVVPSVAGPTTAPGDGTSSPWINASPTTAPAPTLPRDLSTPTTAPGPGGDATATTSSIVLQHEPYGPPTTPGP